MGDSRSYYERHVRIGLLFRALDDARIDWLLFRGEERMQRPAGDIDLLIAARDLDKSDEVLTNLGFSRQGSALLVSRRAYVAYVAEDDLWLRLDVVSRVAFGKLLEFDTTTAAAMLSRRRRVGDFSLPDSDDAFWHLLLHYVLDRGDVPAPWRPILQERALDARAAGPLAEFLDTLTRDVTSRQILEVVRAADWPSLLAMFADVRAAWLTSQSRAHHARFDVQRVLSRLGLSQWTSFRPGLSVAVLGPDGAGKTTLAKGLRESLPIPTKYVYMGLWREGRLEEFLAHVPGMNLLLLVARLAVRMIRLNYYRWRGNIVLLDRYSYDAILVTRDATWRQRITAALVLRMSRPPDLIVILDLPGEVAFARKGEQDIATLDQWRRSYQRLESHAAQLVILDATKSIDDIRRLATDAVWTAIRRRNEPRGTKG